MKTTVLPVSVESIQQAAELIRAGKLVAFPTETVYGLGANALNEYAVKQIFVAKGRPSDNPLIVHISSLTQLPMLVRQVPTQAEKLIQAFWPGPLTLIFPKSSQVPDSVTAGGNSVAVRWPAHPVAQSLIKEAGVPIAAPSANLSGRPSPTAASHVMQDLDGSVPLILNGGVTEVGLESTVLDITGNLPVLLRSGGVSVEEIEKVLEVPVHEARSADAVPRSPGMKYRHYAPRAQVVIADSVQKAVFELPAGSRAAVICLHNQELPSSIHAECFSGDVAALSRQLFSLFRCFDELGYDTILVERISPHGLGKAIMERVEKASHG